MKLETYLHFNGRCEEAIELYKSALGAKVTMLMRFKDMPASCGPGVTPGTENKVMHASLQIGETTLLVSDGRCEGQPKFDGFSISVPVKTDDEADRLFAAIGEGGKVCMPLAKTFFSSRFGMVNDRFGVPWMILVH